MEFETFDSASAGASTTYPVKCSSLKINGHVVINRRPCKVVQMDTAKTGKHGHAKVHIVGLDIFTGNKLEDLSPSTHNVDVPVVTKKDYPLNSISYDGYCSLLLPNLTTRDDVRLPEDELGAKIQEEYDEGKVLILTILSAMDEEKIVSYKVDTEADRKR